jgi:hypothetical protein
MDSDTSQIPRQDSQGRPRVRKTKFPTFQQLFCEYTECSVDSFERRFFRSTLYWHARFLAPLIMRVNREFFHEDLGVIHELANVDCAKVYQMEVSRFYGRNVRDRNLLRKLFFLRISGKKLVRWKKRIFADQI